MKLIEKGETPQAAWEKATIVLFGEGTSGQKKGCPKNAFLGLCEAGLIICREKTLQCNSPDKPDSKNKGYASKAVELIREDRSNMNNKTVLWQKITTVKYNQQLDVVFALIEKGYIKIK
jgi:hypothetical protein